MNTLWLVNFINARVVRCWQLFKDRTDLSPLIDRLTLGWAKYWDDFIIKLLRVVIFLKCIPYVRDHFININYLFYFWPIHLTYFRAGWLCVYVCACVLICEYKVCLSVPTLTSTLINLPEWSQYIYCTANTLHFSHYSQVLIFFVLHTTLNTNTVQGTGTLVRLSSRSKLYTLWYKHSNNIINIVHTPQNLCLIRTGFMKYCGQ